MKHHYVYITKIVLKILLKIYSKILRANTSKSPDDDTVNRQLGKRKGYNWLT